MLFLTFTICGCVLPALGCPSEQTGKHRRGDTTARMARVEDPWSLTGGHLQWGTKPIGQLSTSCTLQTLLGLGSGWGLQFLQLQEGPPPSPQDSSGLYGGQTCLE